MGVGPQDAAGSGFGQDLAGVLASELDATGVQPNGEGRVVGDPLVDIHVDPDGAAVVEDRCHLESGELNHVVGH